MLVLSMYMCKYFGAQETTSLSKAKSGGNIVLLLASGPYSQEAIGISLAVKPNHVSMSMYVFMLGQSFIWIHSNHQKTYPITTIYFLHKI